MAIRGLIFPIVVSRQNEKSENKIFCTFMLFFISVDQFNCECRDLQQFQECTETGRLTQILVFLFIQLTKTEVFFFKISQGWGGDQYHQNVQHNQGD